VLDFSVARRIFRLVTSADHADAIVGDLTEMARVRGPLWFLAQALRVWVRYLFSGFWSMPARSAIRAVVGLFVYAVMYWGLFELVSFRAYRSYFVPGDPLASIGNFPPVVWLKLAFIVAGASLVTGLVLGRFASGERVNGVMPLFAIFVIYWLAWPVFAALGVSLSWQIVLGGVVGFPMFAFLPLAAGGTIGAAIARR
jgi:hypothetical protein